MFSTAAAILSLLAPVQSADVPKAAVLPFVMKDGTETAVKTAGDLIEAIVEKARLEPMSKIRVASAWEDLGHQPVREVLQGDAAFPEMPSPKQLLDLGQKLGVDYVITGRVKWHTKSVWVGLGPKTKADCVVDAMVVDVKSREVALNAEGVKSDSTRKESGLETAGALFVSWGITAFSGGPKTPHQQKAAANAIALSFEPWLKTRSGAIKKIE
jgi:TolB-like protein